MSYNIIKIRENKFPGRGSQARCARLLGVKPQTWHQYENANSLHQETLEKIASVLEVNINDLINDSGRNDQNDTEVYTGGSRNSFHVPLFGGVAAATGGQDSFYDDSGYDEFQIPAGVALLEVKGDSMEPLARDGQKVFLRPFDEIAREGDLVVVWTNGQAINRRLFKRWGGWLCREKGRESPEDQLILVSVNPTDSVKLIEHVRRDEIAGCRIVAGVWYG